MYTKCIRNVEHMYFGNRTVVIVNNRQTLKKYRCTNSPTFFYCLIF